nr:hypothetical protein [Tanacetum cinerariifolium]
MDTCTALSRRVKHLELDKINQALEITKLKRRFKKLERRNKVKMLTLRRLQKVGTTQRVETSDETVMDDLSHQAKEIVDDAKVDESVDIQGRQAESQAKIYKIDLDHANKVLSMQEDETEPAEVQEARELEAELNKNIDWDEVIDHVKKKAKEDPAMKKYQALKRKPQTEAQARKNKSKFNSNVAFLMKTEEQIEEEEESKALKRLNETPAKKAAKRQKLDEEVEELKRHLHIVPNKDDDVYTEATPLTRKVHVVNYEIIEQNNKPYYKIIRPDGTHQLYISFLTLLRNFDREDLEALWSLVKERFSTTKPKNFSNDFLLVTLRVMFEKSDIHAQI